MLPDPDLGKFVLLPNIFLAVTAMVFTYGLHIVDSVVKWLERRDCDRHGSGSKPTYDILLCVWERHYMALSPT